MNKRRQVLGLTELQQLTADTQLDLGLSAEARVESFNKASALRDLKAFRDAIPGFPSRGATEASAILASLERLETDPGLLTALQRRNFVEKGLEFVDSSACPLCDKEWDDEQHLREHLKTKLEKSEEARVVQQLLFDNGRRLAGEVVSIKGLIKLASEVAREQGDRDCFALLAEWKAKLEHLEKAFTSIDGLTGLKEQLSVGWVGLPEALTATVDALRQKVEARPDPTATLEAQTFLTTAQVRLRDFREALRKAKAANLASEAAKSAYKVYCEVMEAELNKLYDDVLKVKALRASIVGS